MSISMPRPWAERKDSEAALLAPPPVTRQLVRPQPGMPRVASPLVGKVTKIGRRQQNCPKHGVFESTGVRFNSAVPHESWTSCATCRDELEEARRQAEARAQAAARRAALEEALARTALPERFIGRTFENYACETEGQERARATLQRFAERFDQHRDRGTSLVLSGGVGTGKSHLAAAAMQALSSENISLYVTLMGLVRMVRDTWRKDSERSETSVLADLARVDLLVIDEVGVQYGTDGEKLMLFEVLDRRYMDRKPTILLTNLPALEFKEFCGDRVYDRLRETGAFVTFDWPSYRAKGRK